MVKKTPIIISEPRPPHHSAWWWDFSTDLWSLSTEHYISPPTSILWIYTDTTDDQYMLAKESLQCMNVLEGTIITWARASAPTTLVYLIFRNNLPPASSNARNCYRVTLKANHPAWTLEERVLDAVTRSWTRDKSVQDGNTWYRWKLSWWVSWDVMAVMLFLQVDSTFIQQGDVLTVSYPLFGDTPYQRIGMGVGHISPGRWTYFDNTQLWAPP